MISTGANNGGFMSGAKRCRRRTARQRDSNRKVEAALEKRELGEELTEYEWMLVQYALGGACSSCGGRKAS